MLTTHYCVFLPRADSKRNSQTVALWKTMTVEHRWGTRVRLNISVRLHALPRAITVGQLRDASLSSGYVQVAENTPLGMPLHMEFDWSHKNRRRPFLIRAYVARIDDDGIALEWSEFAPPQIRTLVMTGLVADGGHRDARLDSLGRAPRLDRSHVVSTKGARPPTSTPSVAGAAE
jgi:hypothetical protein